MTKQYRPVTGMPVDDYLVRMAEDVKEDHLKNPVNGPRMSRSAKEVESMVEAVRRSLNTGACMNESQAEELKKTVLYDRRADATVVKELIDRVNGFRLDCENCLQRDCSGRDPERPIKKVKNRL